MSGHLKHHEIEAARLHGAPRLHWQAPVDGRSETRTTSRCGRYQILRTPSNGRGALFTALYLLAAPHERRIVGVERSQEEALTRVLEHHAGMTQKHLASLASNQTTGTGLQAGSGDSDPSLMPVGLIDDVEG